MPTICDVTSTPPAPPFAGRRRDLPVDLTFVVALALTGYVLLSWSALLRSPGLTRSMLAVMLGLGAGVVALALHEGVEHGRIRRLVRRGRDTGAGSGWQVLRGIHFANIDIDHVVVGAGGVLAVETAHVDWPGPVTEQDLELLDAARRRARRGARRVRLILKCEGIDVDVEAALVVWGGGSPYLSPSLIEGVRIIVGKDEAHWHEQLDGAEATLSEDQVEGIRGALSRQVQPTGIPG
jgi:hypothetical protein